MEIELLDNYIQFIEWKYKVNFTSQKNRVLQEL